MILLYLIYITKERDLIRDSLGLSQGANLGDFKARWAYDYNWPNGTGYEPGDENNPAGLIKINSGAADDYPDAVLHEMGHNVMNNIYTYVYWPSGDVPSPHYIWEDYNPGCAWKEGWATFWVLAIKAGYIYLPSNTDYEYKNWDSTWFDPVQQQTVTCDFGDEVEGRITCSLWDIYDNNDDGYDELTDGINKIWTVFSRPNGHDGTFSDFWDALMDEFQNDVPPARAIFQNTIIYDEVRLELETSTGSGGTVSIPGIGTFTGYEYDEDVQIVASASPNYYFTVWTGTGVDAGKVLDRYSSNTIINMERDYAVTANFEADPTYSVTIDSTSGGTVTAPGEGLFTGYTYDEVVYIIATPDEGCGFVNWTGDVSTIGNVNSASTHITMNGNYSITANFGDSFATLQGNDRPPAGHEVPLTLKLYDHNVTLTPENILTETPLYTYSTTNQKISLVATNPYSHKVFFEVPNLATGTYHVTLSSPHTLINLKNDYVITQDRVVSDMDKLLEGNPNEDVQIAIGDYTTMLGDFLATPTSPPNKWNNGRCDLDRDGQVRGVDFGILKLNYTKTSPHEVPEGKLDGESGGKDSYGTVNLSLQSSASKVYVDDQFSVTINVAAGSQDLVGIDSFLNFNPDYLEVVSVTPGNTLTNTLCNQHDNDEGTIDLCLSTSVTGSPVSGSFTMGTIVFQAKAATSSTAITFNPAIPRKTAVAYQEGSVPSTATGAEVTTCGPPTLRATLQGTGRPYPQGFQVPLTLRLYDEELELDENNIMTAEWLYEYTTEDDEIDIFEINQSTKTIRFRVLWDCPDGVYHVTLWDPHVPHSPPYAHTLINLRNGVTINPSQPEIDMSTLQEGNPNGDVEIGSGDYSIVLNDYLSYPGHANWNDGRSDFNHTLQVNGSDLSLLLMNYGEYSPVVVGEGKLGGEETFTKVDMSIVKSEDAKEISAGSTFTATIEVASKEQKVDAIDAFLAFDPECLEVVSVKPGNALSTVLANRFDNAKGTITLSMGRDPKTEPASGSFTLGTIEFKAKKEAKETRIVFEQKPPRKTDVAYHGESLLGTATDLILEVKP